MRRPHRILLALALLVAFGLALPTQALALRRLGLSSGSFHFDVAAGNTIKGQVVVIDDGNEPIRVLVYSADQNVDSKGGLTYAAPGRQQLTTANNPSSWMSITMPAHSKSIGNTPYLDMKPGQRIPISFSARVPLGTAPGDHNVLLFFEMVAPQAATQGTAAAVTGRLGSRIQIRVNGPAYKKLEIAPFVVPEFVYTGGVPFDVNIHNSGNIDQRVVEKVQIVDRNSRVVGEVTPIDALLVFAGENFETTGTVTSPGMLFGPYKIRTVVQLVNEAGGPIDQGQSTITAETSTFAVPLWMLILVAVLLVLIVARTIWSAAKRAARREAAAASTLAPAPQSSSAASAEPGAPAPVAPPAPQAPQATSTDEWADGGQ